jgi:two-component system, OmpR family, response regulator
MRLSSASLQEMPKPARDAHPMSTAVNNILDEQAPRLLVVDDEPVILELLSASLRCAGFEVITAMTGIEAVEAAHQRDPDLITLDVSLPLMDGFEVMRQLRGNGSHAPVIFLTARATIEDREQAQELGAEDCITKPFSLEQLISRIRVLLGARAPIWQPGGRS